MTTEQTAKQLRLAATILETGHPFMVSPKPTGLWCVPTQAEMNVLKWPVDKYEIRLALATPPDGRAVHNPDNLDAETVGAGYRLLLPEELDGRYQNNCEVWNGKGAWSDEKPVYARFKTFSYRLPLSVPWPEVEEPDPYAELKSAHAEGKVIQHWDDGDVWLDIANPSWCLPVEEYRIKPTESAKPDEPQTKTVPLGPEDAPPGSAFRRKEESGDYIVPTSVYIGGIYGHDEVVFRHTWAYLMAEYQINRSIPLTGKWNPDAWEPCSKTIPA